MITIIFDIVGVLGVFMVLYAYYLIQFGIIKEANLKFSLLNLIGSIFIIFSLLYHWNLPSFIVEVCWAILSVYGIAKVILNKKK